LTGTYEEIIDSLLKIKIINCDSLENYILENKDFFKDGFIVGLPQGPIHSGFLANFHIRSFGK